MFSLPTTLGRLRPANKLWALLLLLFPLSATAQDFIGEANSNYAGLLGIDLNPAAIAKSPYKLDIIAGAGNIDISNNYLSVAPGDLINGFSDVDQVENAFLEDNSPNPKEAFARLNLMLPSVMYSLKDGSAVALTLRSRGMSSISGVPQELAKLAKEGLDFAPLWEKRFEGNDFQIQAQYFYELGLGYARPVLESGAHALQVGARLKLMLGGQSFFAQSEGLDYFVFGEDSLGIGPGVGLEYGFSESFDESIEEGRYQFDLGSQLSPGVDMGAIYEWRPAGVEQSTGPGKPYRLRAGLSITDLGYIRYKSGAFANNLRVDVNDFLDPSLHTWVLNGVQVSSPSDLNDTLRARFGTEEVSESFTMPLPMRISFQLDWNIAHGFFLNLTTANGIRLSERGNRDLSTYTLTPRFESKWAGVSLPILINQFGDAQAGLSFRAGPVVMGTNSFTQLLFADEINAADVYLAVRVPLYKP